MDGYVTLREACQQMNITRYRLERLIASGSIRFKITKVLPSKRRTRFVCLDDVLSTMRGTEMEYIPVYSVRELFPITPNAVRYHVAHGRMRWKRNKKHLFVCKQDLAEYMNA